MSEISKWTTETVTYPDAVVTLTPAAEEQLDRCRRMAELQHDSSPEAGYEFWKLAAPNLEAGFWAARREIHEQNGWTT